MIKVYLAGPIRGLSYDDAVDWRDYVMDQLLPQITAYSPMRGKELLCNSTKLSNENLFTDNPVFTAKGIVRRDFYDIRSCDLYVC